MKKYNFYSSNFGTSGSRGRKKGTNGEREGRRKGKGKTVTQREKLIFF